MGQLDVIGGGSQDEILGSSDLLDRTITDKGLIVVITEKLLDARPCSLILTSLCSTGGRFGTFTLPSCNNILHIDGQMLEKEVRGQLIKCSLKTNHNKVHYLSLPLSKKDADEDDQFLIHRDCRSNINDQISDKNIDMVIVNSLNTCTNYYLSGSKKDVIPWFQSLKQKSVSVVVFCEKGTKGTTSLSQMADITLSMSATGDLSDAPVNFKFIKSNVFNIYRPKPFSLALRIDNNCHWTVEEFQDKNTIRDQVLSMASCGNMTQTEIGEKVGLKQWDVSRIISKAQKEQ